MVGRCPRCGTQIFECLPTSLGLPLGNYRSICFNLEDGRKMEVPMCMKCHDSFTMDKLDKFLPKLYEYLIESCPESWDMDKKAAYASKYIDNNITGYRKLGVLKAKGLEKGQIWK